MSVRLYEVTLDKAGVSRTVRVLSPTDVQAGDAAAPLMEADDAIVAIREVEDDGVQRVDGPLPKSQAAELASVTPGVAAAHDPQS